MKSSEQNESSLTTTIESVALPSVQAPHFKAQLKAKLLAEAAARPAHPAHISGRKIRRQSLWRYGLVAAAMLVVLAWQLFPTPPAAMAFMELEVNPVIRLTVDERGQVMGIELLDETALQELGQIVANRQPADELLTQVIARLHDANLLSPASEWWLVVSPINQASPEALDNLLARAQAVVKQQTERLLTQSTAPQSLVVDSARYEVAKESSLRPSQYTKVAKAGVTAQGLQGLVASGARMQAAGKLTDSRLREFMELVADLVELGVSETEALELVEKELASNRNLDNVARRIERVIERVESGRDLQETVRGLREGNDEEDDQDDQEDEKDQDDDNEDEREGESNPRPNRGNNGNRGNAQDNRTPDDSNSDGDSDDDEDDEDDEDRGN